MPVTGSGVAGMSTDSRRLGSVISFNLGGMGKSPFDLLDVFRAQDYIGCKSLLGLNELTRCTMAFDRFSRIGTVMP